MMPVRRWLRVAVDEGGARVVAVGPKAALSVTFLKKKKYYLRLEPMILL